MKRRWRILVAGAIAVVAMAVVASFGPVRSTLRYLWGKASGGCSVAERPEQFGPQGKKRLRPAFEGAGVTKYPPAKAPGERSVAERLEQFCLWFEKQLTPSFEATGVEYRPGRKRFRPGFDGAGVECPPAKARGGYSVAERLDQYGLWVKKRLKPSFEAAGVKYPPANLALVAFKDSRRMELYARDKKQPWQYIKAYAVLAASGDLGPKLEQGDHQVPEGVYCVDALNPNSRYHLSVRLNYPNDFDRKMAKVDGRTKLGGDIMIHGRCVSIGCLAMGDEAAEELFVLSALVKRQRVKVVISPTDFRAGTAANPVEEPTWVRGLYGTLREELRRFRKGT
ncbi:MAG: L,D-transpeptidase family protein [Thermodesulfobacteriota bacterium]